MNDYIWIATSIFMIIEEYRTKDMLNCDTPISTYNIGNWLIFLYIIIIRKVKVYENRYPSIIQFLTIFSAVFSFLFIFAWTILGTVWIMKNYFYGNNCLGIFSMVVILLIQIIIYFFYFSFFYFFLKIVYESIQNNFQQQRIEDNLINFYNSKNFAKHIDIDEFCDTNKTLLIKTGLFEVEKDIVQKNFTRKIKKKEDINCIICLNEFEIDDLKTSIGCSHFYHYDCLMDWCKIKPTCPCCKNFFRNCIMRLFKNNLITGEEAV